MTELREMYEQLLSLAIEVKQENTDEFMEYYKSEIFRHMNWLGVKEIRIKEEGAP